MTEQEWTVNDMAKRWVKHFIGEYPSSLSEEINKWLALNSGVTIVGISTYISGRWVCAEVILEENGR